MSRLRLDEDGQDWPNRAASRMVDAAGISFHVQVTGAGPPLLLLHGTGASTHSWRDVVPLAARHFQVIAPDLPGHAFSERPADLSLTAMAKAIDRLLDRLGERPAIIAGHSAGAAIAIRMALDVQHPPAALLSIGGALQPFPGMAGALFPAMARLLFANPIVPALFSMRTLVPGETGRFLARATGSTIDAKGVQLYERLFRSPAHVGSALGMMANWDLAPLENDLSRLSVPLTLLHGERDAAVPVSTSRTVARRVAGARLVVLPGLGHLAHEERPELFVGQLLQAAAAAGVIPEQESA
jgi:magnesium chelatase accessory protein